MHVATAIITFPSMYTLPMQFRRLERAGLSPQQAQALSEEIKDLLCVTKEKIQDSCASKAVLREVVNL